jgi:hypothetical protein
MQNYLFEHVEHWGREPVTLHTFPLFADEEVFVGFNAVCQLYRAVEFQPFIVPLPDFLCGQFLFLFSHYSSFFPTAVS